MPATNTKYEFMLDEAAETYAKENLNETEETRNEALEEINRWLDENPNLNARRDNSSLLAFLRGCKFNLDKTKVKLRNFYTMKRDRPEWFRNRNPLLHEIQELVRLGCFVPLKLHHENRLVVIIRPAAHDPKKHKQDDVFKTGKMVLDVAAMEDEKTQIYGVTAIFDMSSLGFGHARQLPPSVIQKAVFAWQNYHCRPKQLEFINAPVYINVVLNVFKSFMSEKLKGRVSVHFNGLESLHQVVDKSILPPEYGGDGDALPDLIQYWHDKLLERRDWFAEDEIYKAEERIILD